MESPRDGWEMAAKWPEMVQRSQNGDKMVQNVAKQG